MSYAANKACAECKEKHPDDFLFLGHGYRFGLLCPINYVYTFYLYMLTTFI